MSDVDFSKADAVGALFHATQMDGVRWSGARRKKTRETDSELENAERYSAKGIPEILD